MWNDLPLPRFSSPRNMELLRDYATQYVAVDMMHHPTPRVVSAVVSHMVTQPLDDAVLTALINALPPLSVSQFVTLATDVTHAPHFDLVDSQTYLTLAHFKRLFRDEREPAAALPAHYKTRGQYGASKGITVFPEVHKYY